MLMSSIGVSRIGETATLKKCYLQIILLYSFQKNSVSSDKAEDTPRNQEGPFLSENPGVTLKIVPERPVEEHSGWFCLSE